MPLADITNLMQRGICRVGYSVEKSYNAALEPSDTATAIFGLRQSTRNVNRVPTYINDAEQGSARFVRQMPRAVIRQRLTQAQIMGHAPWAELHARNRGADTLDKTNLPRIRHCPNANSGMVAAETFADPARSERTQKGGTRGGYPVGDGAA